MKVDKFKAIYKNTKHPLKQANFTNEYGEKFEVYSDGLTLYFSGDETDWQVLPLFNPEFTIWSNEELNELGAAIQKITKKAD